MSGKEQSSDESEIDVGSNDSPEPAPRPVHRQKELLKRVLTDDLKRKANKDTSESGSEKESGASRDSDSSSTSGSSSRYSVPVGSKRKITTKDNFKSSDESTEPSAKEIKKEPFIQNTSCSKVNSLRLSKCRECHKSPDTNQYSCRFYAFRKLRQHKNGYIVPDGFLNTGDATEEDKQLWLPKKNGTLDVHMARFILMEVGDQFCDLAHQEEEAVVLHRNCVKEVMWKRPMQGVREMCDVCKTTLFNFHWACGRCGFVVCIDCYKARQNGSKKPWSTPTTEHDGWKWLKCTNNHCHEQDKLLLCQTIAGNSLQILLRMVHDARKMFGIEQHCKCELSQSTNLIPGLSLSPDNIREIVKSDPIDAMISNLEKKIGTNESAVARECEERMLNAVTQQALYDEDSKDKLISDCIGLGHEDSGSDSEDTSVRDLFFSKQKNISNSLSNGSTSIYSRKSYIGNRPMDSMGSLANTTEISVTSEEVQKPALTSVPQPDNATIKAPAIPVNDVLDEVFSEFSEYSGEPKPKDMPQYFVRRYKGATRCRTNELPIRVMTLTDSKRLYPNVPHSWLCDGYLLRLSDPGHSGNYRIFQDQWRRGQPVVVGNMTKLLNMDLWKPEAFCKDFGDKRNDLINCATGNLVPNRPMREFWEGFEHFSKRLKDEHGNPMLLKLKDWPPGEDFAEMLPKRFADLMKVLPLSEYTHRTGRLNLASCLPAFFVRPDLGPKMYNAYGSALFPTKGTTNLHLDISDAVNFMVYVGIPRDGDNDAHIQEAFKAIDEANCDELTRRNVRSKDAMPGALWHIYHAKDADKIRDLLNKVAIEKNVRLEPHHDPIHDQSWYLDGRLRKRLYEEYRVRGYAIVQCLGDAVFIPAGAPHQVRNLHNCIKVAEDFVSPENVSECFHLTQEFRDLSDTHTNHEDKLQIKNIIYHTIKDAISALLVVGDYSDSNGSVNIKTEIEET